MYICIYVLKFADDTKVFRKVNNDGNKQHLQNDLDKLLTWSENGRWYSILGNVNAYMQVSYRNLDVNYEMGDTVLVFCDFYCKRNKIRSNNKC